MNSKDNATKPNKKKRRNPFRFIPYYFIKITGALPVLLMLRPKRLYASKKAKKHIRGSAVVVANHTHYFDPIAMLVAFWYRRVHSLTIKELFERRLSRLFFRCALCIPVDRQNFSRETFRSAVEVLESGAVLSVFPEGKINSDKSTVQSFKSGAMLMAIRGDAQIVPVYLVPPKKWYNRLVIVLGEPLDPKVLTGGKTNNRTIEEASQKLREKELELQEIYNAWKAKKSSKRKDRDGSPD